MRAASLLLTLLALVACKDDGPAPDDSLTDDSSGPDDSGTDDSAPDDSGGAEDADGDGYTADEDCDDGDPAVNPGATEVCDGRDNNCDAQVDEGVLGTWYADEDGDGYGQDGLALEACEPPEGYVAYAGDCDDADARFNPGAEESDCQDPNDYNCDGSVGYADNDGDGFAACEECDDSTGSINPAAAELCDGLDNDCDSQIDEPEAVDAATWYADTDGDGYGDPDYSTLACDQPSGYSADASDCDDSAAAVNPGAAELCNLLDDDCDGVVDEEATDAATWYSDADGDGYGDPSATTASCEQPSGAVADGSDCDDGDAAVSPAGTELCNGADDDCDGTADEGASDASSWYADTDGDGYGDASSAVSSCEAPSGYVADATDCNDSTSAANPGADEYCDTIDNDCDGKTDEANAKDTQAWYADTDGDGYGDAGSKKFGCSAPSGYVSDKTDCDDGDGAVNPAASELCDEVDNDCDGDVDEDSAADALTWYFDGDCDGAGDSATSATSCSDPGEDWTSDSSDCDDSDSRSYVGATEVCEGADNDCDGTADNSCTTAIEIPATALSPVDSPTDPGGCALIGEHSNSSNPHVSTNLTTLMGVLTGATSGLASSTDAAYTDLDWSIRCGSDYTASIGNYSATTNSWPKLSSTSSYGAGRFRGFINLACGDPLHYTFGVIGNDSVRLKIEGTEIATVNWNDGQWKKFRYVSFPGPGLYAYEVEWSTNLSCGIDPMEIVWAEGFVAGYDNYDTMCASASCVYGDGVAIPGFSVLGGDNLVQTTSGAASSCAQCSSAADCASGETCNDAGLCE